MRHLYRNLTGAFLLLLSTINSAWAQAPVYNVKKYGAKGNGTTLDTKAIDKAIDAANAAGGGTVYSLPGTTFR